MSTQSFSEYSLLVTHHMSDRSRSGIDLADIIEKLGEWIEVEASVYVLWTHIPRREVHKRIRSAVDRRDRLSVVDVSHCASGAEGLLSLAVH